MLIHYIILIESTPQDYWNKHKPHPKGKGGGVAKILSRRATANERARHELRSAEEKQQQQHGFKKSFWTAGKIVTLKI